MTGRRQQGVALAIVVWFLAAMALLVLGIVSEARMDVRLAQAHVARAEVESAGDGAIRLALASLATGRVSAQHSSGLEFEVGGHRVWVELVPVNGLINLNSASEDLLAFLFLQAGGIPADQAQAAANSVIQWRSGVGQTDFVPKRKTQFDAVEDMMRVPGVNRALYDSVRDYVSARSGGGGAIDWSAAPQGLLGQFAEKYPREVAAATRRQEKLADLVGEVGLGGQGAGASVRSGNFRVDATVMYGDKAWLRRQWVTLGSSGRRALPWKVTRTEGPRVKTTG